MFNANKMLTVYVAIVNVEFILFFALSITLILDDTAACFAWVQRCGTNKFKNYRIVQDGSKHYCKKYLTDLVQPGLFSKQHHD